MTVFISYEQGGMRKKCKKVVAFLIQKVDDDDGDHHLMGGKEMFN